MTLIALAVMLRQNSFTSTTARNDPKLNVKSVPNYSIFILDLLTKLNSGVHIATMLYSFGRIVKIAQFINVITILAKRSLIISINLTP
jgi:hypothetical protein